MTFDVPITQGRIFREPTRRMVPSDQTEAIRHAVEDAFGIDRGGLLNPTRRESVVVPRMLAMTLCREMTKLTAVEIGEAFGKKDHGTVLHAVKATQDRIETNAEFARMAQCLKERLR